MKKISEKKLGFILLGSLLTAVSLIFIICGATGVGFKDTRLKDANNALAKLVKVTEVSYNKELSGEEVINFKNEKRRNTYVKIETTKDNPNIEVWGWSSNAVVVDGKSYNDRGGGKVSKRDDYYEYKFNFDYFDIERVIIDFNEPVFVSKIGVYFFG